MLGSRALLLSGCIAAATLWSAQAQAMGAIVSGSGAPAAITDVRIAVSSTGARTSRWVSLHVHGDGGTFAWIVPVKPSASVDLASDAWLESLEAASVPRVVPPDVVPACGLGGVELDGEMGHVTTTPPSAVAVATDEQMLVTTLSGWNLSVSGSLAPLLDAAGADGDSFVALLYTNAPPDVITSTLRVVDTSPDTVPLSLTGGDALATVTAYVFSDGPVALDPKLTLDPSLLLWNTDGSSTYAGVTGALVTTLPGAWFVEAADPSLLFTGEAVPGGTAVPALAPTYFSTAWGYGDTTGSPETCTTAAMALASSIEAAPLACPAGALSQVGAPGCAQDTDAGAGLEPFGCGGTADDLAIALSGLPPAGTWLTRARSVIAAGNLGITTPIIPGSAAAPVGPVVTCTSYDDPCGVDNGGAPPPPGSGGSSGAGSSSGGTVNNGGGGNGAAAAGDIVQAVADATPDDGCGGDTSDGGDSCDGDGGDDAGGGDDCSGGSSDDCTIGTTSSVPSVRHHRHGPTSRIMVLLVGWLALVRRRGRKFLPAT